MKNHAISIRSSIGVALVVALISPTLESQSLCIDAGHGGTKPGNTTSIPNFHEKAINLKVVLRLKDTLDHWGYTQGDWVVYTRLTDTTIPNMERADYANDFGVPVFISVHHNGTAQASTAQGTEVIYGTDEMIEPEHCSGLYFGYRSNIDSLAAKLFLWLRDAFHYQQRGVKPNDSFTVLNCSMMTSAITEASFIDSGHFDAEAYRFYHDSSGHVGKEAGAIYAG
jgi:N-acetylmuramoyl-L-alanine amidase